MTPIELSGRIDDLEYQLRRERYRMAQALEMAHAGVWEWDVQNDVLWWSPKMFEIYDVDPNSFGQRYKDFEAALDPSCVEYVREQVNAANAAGRTFELEFRSRAGRLIAARGRLDGNVMHGVNMDAFKDRCAECPVRNLKKHETL